MTQENLKSFLSQFIIHNWLNWQKNSPPPPPPVTKSIGTSLKLVFIANYVLDKIILIKYSLLTNHDQWLTLTNICIAETTSSFSTRTIRINLRRQLFSFGTSSINLTRELQYTLDLLRLGDIKVRLRLVLDSEVALIYPAENKITWRTNGVPYLKLLYK